MAPIADLVLGDSRLQPAAHCLVCGSDIPPGEGVTARYNGRWLRFRCAGCLARFGQDPERFLAGHGEGCCQGDAECSPMSEWT